jgi:hypothetical protein
VQLNKPTEIHNNAFRNNQRTIKLDIYGFSGTAINKDYAGTAFKLMDKMWQAVKSNNLKNKRP